MDFEDFFTADEAEHGVKVMLPNQFGEPTDHWIVLRHLHSTSYRAAMSKIKQRLVMASQSRDSKERDAALGEMKWALFAALIASWSFSRPASAENIRLLLEKAPYIEDLIDERSSDATLFFRKGSANSLSTQTPAPDSNEHKKTDDLSESTSKPSSDKQEESPAP